MCRNLSNRDYAGGELVNMRRRLVKRECGRRMLQNAPKLFQQSTSAENETKCTATGRQRVHGENVVAGYIFYKTRELLKTFSCIHFISLNFSSSLEHGMFMFSAVVVMDNGIAITSHCSYEFGLID
ncbi:hypothetical protein SUGI_0678900 [Cryptomeria japonica]|nr:hypothetical protein SUGI_0678900 [Cryptomeria japonica]